MLEMTEEQLNERIAAAIAAAKAAPPAETPAELADGDGLTAEMQQRIAAHVQAAEQRAIARMEQEFAAQRRRSELAEFATQVTAGTPDTPRALPVAGDELLAFMAGLNEPQAATARKLFTAIWQNGLVEFGEIGHGRDMRRKQALPALYAERLRSGELALADLTHPIIAQAIGDIAQYDLSEFKED